MTTYNKNTAFTFTPCPYCGWQCTSEHYDYDYDTGSSEHVGTGKSKADAYADWVQFNTNVDYEVPFSQIKIACAA